MKVEIIKKETIKPSSPTPIHLKTYNISVFDQLAPSVYTSLVFVYRPNANNEGRYSQFSQTLKYSLSDTLTIFPPLAGRIKDSVSVDCNDEGVQCYETRCDSTLGQLLSQVDLIACLRRLIAVDSDVDVHAEGQLFVQINLFSCGGIALGVSFSHKLCDGVTFATFLKSWSARAKNSGQVIVPDLTVSTTFPARKDVLSTRRVQRSPPTDDDDYLTTTRLVFDGPKIAALKAKSISQSTPQPTRVEVVTAVIGKCAKVAYETNNKSYSLAPSIFTQMVNLRKILVPSLPETTFGNLSGAFFACSEQSDASLDILVDKLRKARMEYKDSVALNWAAIIDGYVERYRHALRTTSQDMFSGVNIFSSWCRFGLYEVDFGMGMPIWIGVPVTPYPNLTNLLDTKDGNGIEAYVTLKKKDAALFQSDPLLLHYASVNPTVLYTE